MVCGGRAARGWASAMTGGAVLKAASAGAARRLVQSVVVLGLLAASSAAALLGLTLLTSANQGFYAAFTAQHGAEIGRASCRERV